jgi:hypothetical protein
MPEAKAALPVTPAKAGVTGFWSYHPDAAGYIFRIAPAAAIPAQVLNASYLSYLSYF